MVCRGPSVPSVFFRFNRVYMCSLSSLAMCLYVYTGNCKETQREGHGGGFFLSCSGM